MQFGLYGWLYEWLAVFGTEHEVYVIFDERLSHSYMIVVRWATPIVDKLRPVGACRCGILQRYISVFFAGQGRYFVFEHLEGPQ